MKWWQDKKVRKHRFLSWLIAVFRVEDAEFMRLSSKHRHYESKATKKGHRHKHRPAGSKLLKKANRELWEQKYRSA